MTGTPWDISRATAAAVILLNMYIFLAMLLRAGYGLTTAVEAAGVLGLFIAEVVVRLMPGDDPDLPPGADRLAL